MLNHYRDIVHCKIAVRSMSALGQRQTFAPQKVMSALPPKADMCVATRDDSGRSSRSRKCLICGILYAGEQEDICSRAFPALRLDNDKLAHHSGVLVLEIMAVIHVWMFRVGKICKLGYDAHSRTRID
jgi:hypothetical protein